MWLSTKNTRSRTKNQNVSKKKNEKVRVNYFECYKTSYIIKRDKNVFPVEWVLVHVTKKGKK